MDFSCITRYGLVLDFGGARFYINVMKRCKKNWKLWAVIVVLFLLLAGTCARQACTPATANYPVDEAPKLTEVWSYGSGDVKAARIFLDGIILRPQDEGLFSSRFDMVGNALIQIRAAERDSHVRAIILEVNSPGGGVTPSDEIYNALHRFRDSRPDRRVVVFIRDLGASGAYYAAMAADWIVAEPTAVVGSVGVIMQSINFQPLSEKLGISDVTIRSGENKDMLNPFKPVDANQLAILQGLIDDMQNRFAGLVAEARRLDRAGNPELFDGRIFSAGEALNKGLIDSIGYWDDAVAHTAALLDTGALKIIRYEAPRSLLETLLFSVRARPVLPEIKINSSQFLYLWKP